MLDAENPATPTLTPTELPAGADTTETSAPVKKTAKKATAKKAAGVKAPAKKVTATGARRTTKKVAEPAPEGAVTPPPGAAEATVGEQSSPAKKTAKKAAAKKATAKKAASSGSKQETDEPGDAAGTTDADVDSQVPPVKEAQPAPVAAALLFQAPEPTRAPRRVRAAEAKTDSGEGGRPAGEKPAKSDQSKSDQSKSDQSKAGDGKPGDNKAGDGRTGGAPVSTPVSAEQDRASEEGDDTDGEDGGNRRRRRRGGRRRRKSEGGEGDASPSDSGDTSGPAKSGTSGDAGGAAKSDTKEDSEKDGGDDSGSGDGTATRRRRRRRRTGEDSDSNSSDDPQNTVTRVRKTRSPEDEITALSGSTRLEAKKVRRREGREAGRRRAPIVSEAEFLARREAVDRVMVIRQRKDLTQIAVLEDKVLVEHYVARESQTSLIGNVYLGRVQNVLPSMEAAFIDIGKGRNAVLYAGEVNWGALGAKDGRSRKIESVLKSGQPVLVQVSKDPIGHKGARLTSQISLPGRFLVYVPDGTTSGISRKLPDTERNRLKTLLKEIVPDSAGVIVRTAAEGASEEELTRDVERLTARWDDISGKVEKGNAPALLYGEPDLTLKVVRDLFTEDFAKLVVSGDDAWDIVDGYVEHVAPDLADRLEKYDAAGDVFAAYRIDEQIAKGLDRKVWLPSGGSLVIDRTEAMTVVDVNTGKFTGSGGNLEETVTKNNLEAAEEVVLQLRLRDIGGIIVVDFIDMVLESNRDLVLRRMIECLGRDRTRHQVAEVTSLGLVQMTRKRIGTGLLEAFSESCEHCQGRGLIVARVPVEPKHKTEDEPQRNRRGGRNRGRGDDASGQDSTPHKPSPKDVAAAAKPERHADSGGTAQDRKPADEKPATEKSADEKPATEKSADERADDAGARKSGANSDVADQKPSTDGGSEKPVVDQSTDVTTAEVPAGDVVLAPAEPVVPLVPAEPAAPRLVTGVRRRGAARRPAGPPVALSGETASSDDAGSSEPVDSPVEVSPVGQSAVEDSAFGTGTVEGGALEKSGDAPHDVLVETPEPVTQAHVPIKKKGSRKR